MNHYCENCFYICGSKFRRDISIEIEIYRALQENYEAIAKNIPNFTINFNPNFNSNLCAATLIIKLAEQNRPFHELYFALLQVDSEHAANLLAFGKRFLTMDFDINECRRN